MPAILIALVLSLGQRALAVEDIALDAQLQALVASHQGKVAVYATDVRSGRTASIDAHTAVPTASVIKLVILFEALKQVQEGGVKLTDALTLRADNQVEGSGVLGLFDTPLQLTLKDALTMMIVVSDNTATNLVIDYLGLENIDRRIAWMGLHDTWLYKKVFKPVSGVVPADQKKFGLGKTTAQEMAEVMQHFATCNLNAQNSTAKPSAQDQTLCDAALQMLKNQTDRDSIPRYLGDITIANKTGALDEVRNDVAIAYARNGPVIVSEFTYDNKDQRWTSDNAAQVLMARLAKTIVDRWN
ncbi:MAG: class A beta-lactamase-related serine hydrolase [Candidatus Eremiobacteraeota bacterium]|nr:class A beta-lactamase-related serine hydrolase [Candidatus Eremiobacteraeota bacterium]